jgi:RNA polymerase sigma-70 factor (ECF subfamily)
MRIAARYRAGAAGDGCDQSLAPSLERTLAARQELELVLAAIEELPPRRREIVKLARLQGLSGKEIAMRLGIRQKSVEKQLGLAIAELTRYLQAAQAQEAAAVRSRKQRKPGSHHG